MSNLLIINHAPTTLYPIQIRTLLSFSLQFFFLDLMNESILCRSTTSALFHFLHPPTTRKQGFSGVAKLCMVLSVASTFVGTKVAKAIIEHFRVEIHFHWMQFPPLILYSGVGGWENSTVQTVSQNGIRVHSSHPHHL